MNDNRLRPATAIGKNEEEKETNERTTAHWQEELSAKNNDLLPDGRLFSRSFFVACPSPDRHHYNK